MIGVIVTVLVILSVPVLDVAALLWGADSRPNDECAPVLPPFGYR